MRENFTPHFARCAKWSHAKGWEACLCGSGLTWMGSKPGISNGTMQLVHGEAIAFALDNMANDSSILPVD